MLEAAGIQIIRPSVLTDLLPALGLRFPLKTRYLLCRPQGGLNDKLCQIERCCRYAEHFGRTVIVDTAYAGGDSFHDDFGRYFQSRQPRLILSLRARVDAFEGATVVPTFLQDRINEYQAAPKVPQRPLQESASNLPLSFDFSRDHDAQVLVHHQDGGGRHSLFALLRMSLRPALVAELQRRLHIIGGPYLAVHVRHTDYSSSYVEILQKIKTYQPPKLFLATDSQAVLDEFRGALKNTQVLNFSHQLSQDGTPVHLVSGPGAPSENFVRNRDAIIDLLMLSLSKHLLAAPLAGRPGASFTPKYSGFSLLAKGLQDAKVILRQLVGPLDWEIGLS